MPLPQEWQLQDAKNRLSEVVKLAQSAPQTVTVHGKPSAVVISFKDYRALTKPKKSLLEVMQAAPKGFGELELERSKETDMREVTL